MNFRLNFDYYLMNLNFEILMCQIELIEQIYFLLHRHRYRHRQNQYKTLYEFFIRLFRRWSIEAEPSNRL